MSRITNTATWTSADGMAVATVERHGCENTFRWQLSLNGELLASGEDLREPTYRESERALEALSSFFDAWNEALQYEARGRTSDNRDLFPDSAIPWADGYAEEFGLWGHDQEAERES